jgi:tRNA acetyltransferase TAN1
MYGIKGVHDTEDTDGDDAEDDIEAAIQKELAALDAKGTGSATAGGQNLTPIKMSVDCLLFVKTRPPIDPVAFVRRICEDAKSRADPGQMRCRYVNRLTPVTATAKATEQGLVELAKEVLGPFFDLSGKRSGAAAVAKDIETVAEGSEARNGEGESGGIPPEPNTEAASGHELPAPPPKNQGFTVSFCCQRRLQVAFPHPYTEPCE